MMRGGIILWQRAGSSGNVEGALFESLLWLGALIGLFLLLLIVAMWARKWRRLREVAGPAGLRLDELRRQRDKGLLTVAEYEALRAVVAEQVRNGRGDDADRF